MDHRKSRQSGNPLNRASDAHNTNEFVERVISSEEFYNLDEGQTKVEKKVGPSRLELTGPSLIDDEIILVDEVLHQKVQISKSVVLNVDPLENIKLAPSDNAVGFSDVRKSVTGYNGTKDATGTSQIMEDHLASRSQETLKEVGIRNFNENKSNAALNHSQRDIAKEKRKIYDEVVDKSKHKLNEICEDIGFETPELIEDIQEITAMSEERGIEAKSDVNLIKVFSSRNLKDIDQIHETFFEDYGVHVIDSFKEFEEEGADDQISADEPMDSNYPSAEQRGSDATAVKFMIHDSDHTMDFSSRRKDKKSKGGKGKKVAYKRPSCVDSTVRTSDISEVPSSSNISKAKSLTIDPEQDDGDAADEKRKTKMAMMMRRISLRPVDIVYSFEGRLAEADDAMESWYNFNKPSDETQEVLLPQTCIEVAEEASLSEEVEEEERLDREPYFVRYANAMENQRRFKMKNFILQKYITMHLRRRKTTNFLMEAEPPLDQVNMYNQRLITYGEVMKIENDKRLIAENETNFLKESRENKFLKCVKLFDDYQNHEENIGRGLIHSKTGKSIPDKLVERYIRRQRSTMNVLCRMRVEFIKLKSMHSEKTKAVDDLNKITPTRRLVEYEQLKTENRGLADRIEEKEEDLVRIRSKCQNTIQVLAHLREKSAALEVDINELTEDLNMIELVARSNREAVNALRKRKTEIRYKINKLKDESGLLTEPMLLHDMDETRKEVDSLSGNIQELKQDVETRTKEIEIIKLNLKQQKQLFAKQHNIMYPISLYSKSLSFETSIKSTTSTLRQKLFNKSVVSILSKTSRRSKVNLWGTSKKERHETTLFKKSDKVAFDDLVRIKAPSTLSTNLKKTSRSHLFNM